MFIYFMGRPKLSLVNLKHFTYFKKLLHNFAERFNLLEPEFYI